MNIVFVKHSTDKEFAFYVPDALVPHVKKGKMVVVETMHGVCVGTATTGVITGPGALDIAKNRGAYEPLKPVVGFACEALRIEYYREVATLLQSKFSNVDELPF